jgi:hypothetical protein
MHNQRRLKGMLQKIERVAPQLQDGPITHGTSLWRFLCLSLLASSLLLMGLSMRAQDLSKKQEQLLSQQSGFLDDYSKLQPDSKDPGLLIHWANKGGHFTFISSPLMAET